MHHPSVHQDEEDVYSDISSDEEHEEEENSYDGSGATFDDKLPMSFDTFFSKMTQWITYACAIMLAILVLIIFGGVFITFLDKWHEERQIQHAYYHAVSECNERSIQSEELLKACQNSRRELGKSVIFGAVKKTFFEMVRSMDDCVWYLKSSPAAWLLLAVVSFFVGCKLLWPARDENFPMYLRWIQRSGLSNLWKPKRSSKKYRKKRRNLSRSDPGYQVYPVSPAVYYEKGSSVHIPFSNNNENIMRDGSYNIGMRHRSGQAHTCMQIPRLSVLHTNCTNSTPQEIINK